MTDLVGLTPIGERLGVARATVDSWPHRGKLPQPHQMIGIHPFWEWKKLQRQIEQQKDGKK
jgi:hypothetical protein